ncbi:glycerol-3-phosphate 1-O-acyltransferase PlsY [Mycoplasma enhydrae]|uniref:glycerol-3-phosphate 1-O-acyltransferase PlsY n=1 Tax=Mycoplasma enhydrae TaxID=2499220 RepID=UPI00197B9DC2|nr:glycerol-3-phosphate 1-O-acyltransferase PlsY [Mycoplasma enhydrae]MBN4089637.1 glycerol-3-phosphate 1-O-acyltransferase PlsY [Mycoplasma enhydrae]MCV3733769.1 glycerol-3-phosphate 1-O-acyltransferase PlsY [Mycoplasma enhydrae]
MFKWEYVWINFIILIIGYFIGSINISIILSKTKNKDIRQEGSKNAGATNALRVFGFKFAALVFAFDLLKSFIPTLIVFIVKVTTKNSYIIPLFAGLGAFIGHIIPLYFKFKGGKGVASFFGLVLAFDFPTFLWLVLIYLIFVLTIKYISLCSVIATIIFAFISFIPQYYGTWLLAFMNKDIPLWSHSYILVFASIIILLKHIPNYIRISIYQEKKLEIFKKCSE